MDILHEFLRQRTPLQRMQEFSEATMKRCCNDNDLSYDRF